MIYWKKEFLHSTINYLLGIFEGKQYFFVVDLIIDCRIVF